MYRHSFEYKPGINSPVTRVTIDGDVQFRHGFSNVPSNEYSRSFDAYLERQKQAFADAARRRSELDARLAREAEAAKKSSTR